MMTKNLRKLFIPLTLFLILIFSRPVLERYEGQENVLVSFLNSYSHTMITLLIAWILIVLLRGGKILLLRQYDMTEENNLKSRKVHTQINILERVAIFLIALFAAGMILLSFEKIREIGVGLFASAGLAGIILGISAQKVVGALLAGIQIAFAQPFRLDDAVVVENEWGHIEEINLTYVVIKLWDKRRLILPSTYFLDQPFQNWTRTSAEITGSVFLYTDYTVPFAALRAELTRLLEGSTLWDGQVNVLQVTAAKESTVEIRVLVSARNAPAVWDLRVYIREKLIEFIQEKYPQSLPRTRVVMEHTPDSPPRSS